MTLRDFITRLEAIAMEHGDDLPVLAFDRFEDATMATARYEAQAHGEPAHVWIVGDAETWLRHEVEP